jgi:hypothetical protein
MICEDSFYVVTEVHISLAAVERGDDLYFARGAQFVCSDGEEDAPFGPGCKASFTRNLENLNPCVSLENLNPYVSEVDVVIGSEVTPSYLGSFISTEICTYVSGLCSSSLVSTGDRCCLQVRSFFGHLSSYPCFLLLQFLEG